MEAENELNINIQPGEGVQKVIIQHNDPEIIHEEEKINLTGVITSPSEFYQKRSGQFFVDSTYVEFDKKNLSITFVGHDKSYFKQIVTGKLIEHPFLKGLNINSEHSYSVKTLMKKLQFARQWFLTKSEHKQFLTKLRNFTAKVETTMNETNDRAGNMSSTLDQKIVKFKEEGDLKFTLSVPLFEGQEKITVPIYIELEPNGGQPALFLMFDELDETKEELIDKIFAEQAHIFSAFPLIYKN